MDPVVTVAAIGCLSTIVASWLDMRARTNGKGAICKKLDRIEDIVFRHIESHH